jgi:Protein of unknown function (DUF2946)
MDEAVLRSVAKWPDVPDVYGWLALDARGEWRLRNPASESMERIANAALREFIARNYGADRRGAWFFQNGPQRVFVRLERTPLVFRLAPSAILDHCGWPAGALRGAWLDERGALLLAGERGIGVIDDRDLSAASRHIVDGRGAPLDESLLTALLESEVLQVGAYFVWDGATLGLQRVSDAVVATRFGFVREPRP